MPPLPSSLNDEASELVASIQRRQKDISEIQLPRLRQCNGPLPVQQKLAAELREDLDVLVQNIDALEILIDDQKGARNRKELAQIIDEHRRTLASIRKDYRAALLASKRAIDSQNNSLREELLKSSAVTEKRDPNEKVTGDALMKASSDVTEALQRTIGLMQGELERSVLTSQMLDSSTASLRATSSTHDTLTNIMGTSKQLITALEKSDWLDRLLITSALIFFFLVVLFILKQRIVDRGLRVALWWTRFIPDFSGDSELLRMDKDNVEMATTMVSAVVSVSSIVPAALSTASVLSAESSAFSSSVSEDSGKAAGNNLNIPSFVSPYMAESTQRTSLVESPDGEENAHIEL